jgi:hypothetical protein
VLLLCVVHAAALCKPVADGNGWTYSTLLVDLVRQYKATWPTVLAALEPQPAAAAADGSTDGGGGERRNVKLYELFPSIEEPEQQDAKLQEVRSKSVPAGPGLLPLVASCTVATRCQLLCSGASSNGYCHHPAGVSSTVLLLLRLHVIAVVMH